jgi:hypothetical protein
VRVRYIAPKRNISIQTAPPGEGGFLSEAQILARIPVSRRTLGSWKAKGILPFIKINRRCLYSWDSVREALLRKERGGQE